jgi:hypothetical protein
VSGPECVESLPYRIYSENSEVASIRWEPFYNQDFPDQNLLLLVADETLTRKAAGEIGQVLTDFAEGRIKWEKRKCPDCEGTGRASDRFELTGYSRCNRCDSTGEEIVMAWYADPQEEEPE